MRRKYSLTIERNMVFLDKVSVDHSKGLWRVFLVKKCGGLVLALIMMMDEATRTKLDKGGSNMRFEELVSSKR